MPAGTPRFVLMSVALAALAAAQDSRAARQAAMETITAADLKAHLSFLASDEMRGRVTPSKELDIAAKYLAAQFEKAGAKPAAPGGGFFQVKKTPVVAFELGEEKPSVAIEGADTKLTPWEQVDVAVRGSGSVSLQRAPLVVVEVEALASREPPEGLEGKVVIAALAKWSDKRDPLESLLARAEAAGAEALILVRDGWTPPEGLRPLRRAKLEAQRVAPQDPRPGTVGLAIEDEALGKRLMAAAKKLAGAPPASAAANASVTFRLRATRLDAEVSNVVASVEPGPGPQAGEAIIFTAHYDHIGMTAPVEGDWIYNGADDDGSGTVALLELAQAYAALKPAPARRVLFCAFFGEEKGGLGSKYYVENPAHPLEKTVCDVNIEMIGRSFGVGKKVAWVTGFDYSDLGERLAEGAAAIGVKIIADPYPRQNFFLRSDNVAFVRHKVPGHSISAGSTHADYHGVNDEVDRIEFDNMEAIVRSIFLGAAPIADGSHTVRWTREIPRLR